MWSSGLGYDKKCSNFKKKNCLNSEALVHLKNIDSPVTPSNPDDGEMDHS
jgi:hypothetical protein